LSRPCEPERGFEPPNLGFTKALLYH